MNTKARLAFALAVSMALAGCGESASEPDALSLEPGRRAFVDHGTDANTIAWTKRWSEDVGREDSIWIDCGTTGVYLGDDKKMHRFKPDNGPVLWLIRGDLRPLPPAR